MLKFVVYVVVLGICFDQGLTQGASENLGGPPGRPGKRGVPGQKGEVGEKGMKGEAGAPAPKGTNQLKAIQEMLETHSNQIQLLEDKIYSLCKQTTKPENGWYA
ncbi:unnamed protein product [Clavelina lepadiformis]|uniref:Uncharacterized protein n=1 Tax=Clavelina lepadiformis TaxID=159417 RepID=A0ABP0FDD1_CLALP